MSKCFTRVRLLMWKNCLLQKRKVYETILEILFPAVFASMCVVIHILTKPVSYDQSDFYKAESILAANNYSRISELDIGYTPDCPCLETLMAKVVKQFAEINVHIGTVTALKFKTENELIYFYQNYKNSLGLAVVFSGLSNNSSALPNNLTYFIRPHSRRYDVWFTNKLFPVFQYGPWGENSSPDYITNGVVQLQVLIGQALISRWLQNDSDLLYSEWQQQRMPWSRHMVGELLPLVTMVSFILSVMINTKNIVYEKEQKLKETMKTMGLTSGIYWISWFLTCMTSLSVAIIIVTILWSIPFSNNGPVLGTSSPSLALCFFFVYAWSLVSFCLMMSVFVQNAMSGVVLSSVAYFLSYMPYLFVQSQYQSLEYAKKMIMGVLFNSAMAFGMNVFAVYQTRGKALLWSDIHKPVDVSDNFSLLDAILMLFVDTVFHFLVMWYVDNVNPGEFGVPKPYLFMFKRTVPLKMKLDGLEEEHSRNDIVVVINKVTKVFRETNMAVKKLSLTLLKGHINILLGRHGAGKSTTIFMLTGFTPLTSGAIFVNGKNISTDLEHVRKQLGYCPQQDTLFDNLTVKEHLIFFSKLKGCGGCEVQKEVQKMLIDVDLQTHDNARVKTLSSGQKRKLSLGIALIHGSNLIILDEPTSGMDPSSRRKTWDLIQRYSYGRTLLVTTHLADEAEMLGDRVAIISEGEIKCCGSSVQLKKSYGNLYHVKLGKSKNCKVDAIQKIISDYVPSAILVKLLSPELSFLLPEDCLPSIPHLLEELITQKDALGIRSFGISTATMDDVFIKASARIRLYPVAKESIVFGGRISAISSRTSDITGHVKKTGVSLMWTHFRAIFITTIRRTWRNRFILVTQILLPVTFTILALLTDVTLEKVQNSLLVFDINTYGRTYVPYSINDRMSSNMSVYRNYYVAQFDGLHDPEMINICNTSECWSSTSEYLVHRAKQLSASMYFRRVVIGAEIIPRDKTTPIIRALYNPHAYHALPTSIAVLLKTLCFIYFQGNYSLISGVNPLPKCKTCHKISLDERFLFENLIQLMLSFGMAILTSSFAYFIIQERAVGARHLHILSGVDHVVLCVSNLACYFLTYAIVSVIIVFLLAASETPAFMESGQICLVMALFFAYGWAKLPSIYLFSFLFSCATTAFVIMTTYTFIIGILTTMTFHIVVIGSEDVRIEQFEWLLLFLSPTYCFYSAILDMYSTSKLMDMCKVRYSSHFSGFYFKGLCYKRYGLRCSELVKCLQSSSTEMDLFLEGANRNVLVMVTQGIVFLGLNTSMEIWTPWFRCRWLNRTPRSRCVQKRATTDVISSLNLFPSVQQSKSTMQKKSIPPLLQSSTEITVNIERDIMNNIPQAYAQNEHSLLLGYLHKQYGNVVVVDSVCVNVPSYECLGLLGINGCGKTTMLKMLAGDVTMDSGNAFIEGIDIKNNFNKVLGKLGYCPQVDSLIGELTGRETITLYARLRGIPEESIQPAVNSLIDTLILQPDADFLCREYSEGSRRKVSVAIALVGDPSIIILDEPFSGMNLDSCRQLREALFILRASGKTIVLASHDIAKCERVCSRFAIMTEGRLSGLGSPQYLKSKSGQWYTLIAKLQKDSEGVNSKDAFVSLVQSRFQGASVFEEHDKYIQIHIPKSTADVVTMYTVMETAMNQLNVQYYSFHSSSVEDIVLTLRQ